MDTTDPKRPDAPAQPTQPDPPTGPEQRRQLLDNEARAARPGARNFKDDALEKTVSIQPDGTGPSSTGTLDAEADQRAGSGSPTGARSDEAGRGSGPKPGEPSPRSGRDGS